MKHWITITIIHVLFWSFQLNFDYFIHQTTGELFIINTSFVAILFYLNYFLFAKQIVVEPNTTKLILYFFLFTFIVFCSLLGLTYIIYSVILQYKKTHYEIPYTLWNALQSSLYIWSVSTGTRMLLEWLKNKKSNQDLQSKVIENQLKTFKHKVDFTFVSAILLQLSQKSILSPISISDAVIQLSELLRYSLQANSTKTKVSEELKMVSYQNNLFKVLDRKPLLIKNHVPEDFDIDKGSIIPLLSIYVNYTDSRGNLNILFDNSCYFITLEGEPDVLSHIYEVLCDKKWNKSQLQQEQNILKIILAQYEVSDS